MSDILSLPRPASLPDVRTELASSPRTSLIATLEPFQGPRGRNKPRYSSSLNDSGQPSRPKGPRGGHSKAGHLIHHKETLPGVYECDSYEKYLILKSLNGKPLMELDIFEVHRSLVKVCGREPKVIPQGDGSLLVETTSPEESLRLRSLTSVPGADVSCSPHATMNQTRGVVFSRDLLRYSEDRLLQELEQHNVVSVQRVHKTIDGIPTPTPTLFLTFNQLTLPSVIKCAWLSLPVKPFVPNPRRCFHCQAYGHVTRTCRCLQNGLPGVCVLCGRDDHGEDCPGPMRCYHCGESHPASSKDCARYRLEKEILIIRNKERVSFAEAKRQAMERFGARGRTFASFFERTKAPGDPRSVPRPQQPASKRNDVSPASLSQTPAIQKSAIAMEHESLKVISADMGQQKRSRSEDSLEGVPPAKIQSPEPTSGSAETPKGSAAEANPAPVRPGPSGPANSGAEAGSATLPSAVASSPSSASSATAPGWQEVAKRKIKKTVTGEKGRQPVTTPRGISSHARRPTGKIGKGQSSQKGSPTPQS